MLTSSTVPLGNDQITVGVNDLTLGPHYTTIQLTTTTKVGRKMDKVIVRTEKWGNVIKAVVRDENGRFIGATNQTKSVPQTLVIVGK